MLLQKTQKTQETPTIQVIQATPTIKILNLAELAVKNPGLSKFYLQNPTIIDVSHIHDANEIEDIANILREKANITYNNNYIFHKNTIKPFIRVIQKYDNSGLDTYCTKICNTKNLPYGIRKIATTILAYLKEKEIGDNLIYNHIIYLKNAHIAPERMGTGAYQSINCNLVTDLINRDLIEKWAISMLMETDLSVSTLTNKIRNVIHALNQQDLPCTLWTDDNVRICFNKICLWQIIKENQKRAINDVASFFNYLVENKLILSSIAWLLAEETGIKTQNRYKMTAPSEYVIAQIFNALAYANDDIKISFLLLYTTGMRISEMQILKRDCLDIRENAIFIKYYQFKMRKEVSNVIPYNLAKMIQKYIENNNIPSEYLFCNKKGNKIFNNTFRTRLKEFFKKHNIKNEDGTPYCFTPHSYRHLMAVRMHRYKIPYRYIQKQLHHDTPLMTMFYLEYLDNERIKKMSNWINGKGQKITPENLTLNIHHAQIETAILPNGLCTRPAMLPNCKHCNTCYGCNYFTTSKEWLPILKQQKERLIGFIDSAKNKGWNKAVINSQRTLEQLNKIIKNLEE